MIKILDSNKIPAPLKILQELAKSVGKNFMPLPEDHSSRREIEADKHILRTPDKAFSELPEDMSKFFLECPASKSDDIRVRVTETMSYWRHYYEDFVQIKDELEVAPTAEVFEKQSAEWEAGHERMVKFVCNTMAPSVRCQSKPSAS